LSVVRGKNVMGSVVNLLLNQLSFFAPFRVSPCSFTTLSFKYLQNKIYF
jgi:hypothetical protein